MVWKANETKFRPLPLEASIAKNEKTALFYQKIDFMHCKIVSASNTKDYLPYLNRIWPVKCMKYVADKSSSMRALYAELIFLPTLQMAAASKLASL